MRRMKRRILVGLCIRKSWVIRAVCVIEPTALGTLAWGTQVAFTFECHYLTIRNNLLQILVGDFRLNYDLKTYKERVRSL